jgi:hypothetical protein
MYRLETSQDYKRMGVAREINCLIDHHPSIGLQLGHRRSAARGLERGPNRSAGGPQGRLAEPRKKEKNLSLPVSTLYRLKFNDIRIYFI